MMTAQKSNRPYNKNKHTFSYLEAFFAYPYKKWIQNTAGVTKPYVKKEDRTSTPFSLTYKEWKHIIDTYLDVLAKHILEGDIVKIPHFGELSMVKRKTRINPIDWNKTKKLCGRQKGKKAKDITLIRHKNLVTDGHLWMIEWAKLGDSKLKHSSLWRIKSLKGFNKMARETFRGSNVYRYRDIDSSTIKSKSK